MNQPSSEDRTFRRLKRPDWTLNDSWTGEKIEDHICPECGNDVFYSAFANWQTRLMCTKCFHEWSVHDG